MKLFSEEVKTTSSNSPLNILQVANFDEIFFGVLEVQINEKKYPVEEVAKYKGNPVVMIPIVVEGVEVEYPFILNKGQQEIFFNSENTTIPEVDCEILEESYNEDSQKQILEDIAKLKKDSVRQAQEEIARNAEIAKEQVLIERRKKERALKKYLESARENLVNEFTSISKKIKNELISDNDVKFEEIRESVDNKIDDIAKSLSQSLGKNLQNSSKIIDKSIKKLVVDLYENTVTPRVDKELEVIAEDIYKKVSEIGKDLDNKLSKKVDTSLLEGVNKELDAIRDANIELNNSLNKGVQKALSRVGNVDKKILDIAKQFDKKITITEQEITRYFDEKLSLVKEETLDITDESRKYLRNLIQESRNGLLSEIRKIKDEKPVEYILESKKGKPIVKDWGSIEKDWDKKIHDKFENYKTDLRKYIVYASGGGTNATQYQDGGVINGDLHINAKLFANEIQTPSLSSEKIKFDTSYIPTGSESVGTMYWNNVDGTVDLVQDGATQQVGQELFIKVRNTSGDVILNGTPVYFDGRTGNRPKIYPAKADNHTTSVVMGITTHDIANNSDGLITSFGYVRQIKTNHTGSGIWGTTWNEGDNLYVSKINSGQLTNVEPNAPHHSDIVGQVGIVGGVGVGSILVNIKHHSKLESAADVIGSPSTTGQIPTWNSALSAFDFNYNINNYLPLSDLGVTAATLSSNIFTGNQTISRLAGNDTLIRLQQAGFNTWDICSKASSTALDIASTTGSKLRVYENGDVAFGILAGQNLLEIKATTSLEIRFPFYSDFAYAANINFGDYSSIGSLRSGAGFYMGTGVKTSNANGNSLVKMSGGVAHFFYTRYDRGLEFHSGITGAAGAIVADTTNLRARISDVGVLTVGSNASQGGWPAQLHVESLWTNIPAFQTKLIPSQTASHYKWTDSTNIVQGEINYLGQMCVGGLANVNMAKFQVSGNGNTPSTAPVFAIVNTQDDASVKSGGILTRTRMISRYLQTGMGLGQNDNSFGNPGLINSTAWEYTNSLYTALTTPTEFRGWNWQYWNGTAYKQLLRVGTVGVGIGLPALANNPTSILDVRSDVTNSGYFTSSAASTRVYINNAANTGFGLQIAGATKFSTAVYQGGTGNFDFSIYNDQSSSAALFIDGDTNNVGIGTSAPNAKAILDLTSTTKGFLLPRMTTTQRDAITSPPAALEIFNTTTNKKNFYNGTAWEEVTSVLA